MSGGNVTSLQLHCTMVDCTRWVYNKPVTSLHLKFSGLGCFSFTSMLYTLRAVYMWGFLTEASVDCGLGGWLKFAPVRGQCYLSQPPPHPNKTQSGVGKRGASIHRHTWHTRFKSVEITRFLDTSIFGLRHTLDVRAILGVLRL